MRLTLLKSAVNPDPAADLGNHEFTYSLLPHDGDWFKAGTAIEAHKLNIPVEIAELPEKTTVQGTVLPASTSFFTCEGEHVAVDTIKRAEDSNEWIVRCYEFGGKRGVARFNSYFTIAHVDEVNLMEREEQAIEHSERGFEAYFTPFEIKTFCIRLKS